MYNQSHFFLEKFSWQKFVGTCYRLITNEIKIKLNQFNRKKKKIFKYIHFLVSRYIYTFPNRA